MSDPKFWRICSSMESMTHLERLMVSSPPRFEVDIAEYFRVGVEEIIRRDAFDELTHLRSKIDIEELGAETKLTIMDLSFDQDYIQQSGPFCSKNMRDIFDLDDEIVQYLPVDTSMSPPNIQEKDYKQIYLLAFQEVIDLEKSTVHKSEFPDLGERVIAVRRIVLKENAHSEFEIFRDPHDPRWLVTDAFAQRILESGTSDIMFFDPAPTTVARIKTLGGIQEFP